MSRDFELRVFGDGGGLPLIVYPTSFGNFHQCKDFQLTDACADFVERGRITLPNLPDPWKYNHMRIIIGIGEWDNTRHESLRLSALLNDKGINHWLDDRKWCGHDWNYWREMLPYHLSTL